MIQKVTLLSVIPHEIFLNIEKKVQADLTKCYGYLIKEPNRDVWFGFANEHPLRCTYRYTDGKCAWGKCHPRLIMEKQRLFYQEHKNNPNFRTSNK